MPRKATTTATPTAFLPRVRDCPELQGVFEAMLASRPAAAARKAFCAYIARTAPQPDGDPLNDRAHDLEHAHRIVVGFALPVVEFVQARALTADLTPFLGAVSRLYDGEDAPFMPRTVPAEAPPDVALAWLRTLADDTRGLLETRARTLLGHIDSNTRATGREARAEGYRRRTAGRVSGPTRENLLPIVQSLVPNLSGFAKVRDLAEVFGGARGRKVMDARTLKLRLEGIGPAERLPRDIPHPGGRPWALPWLPAVSAVVELLLTPKHHDRARALLRAHPAATRA